MSFRGEESTRSLEDSVTSLAVMMLERLAAVLAVVKLGVASRRCPLIRSGRPLPSENRTDALENEFKDVAADTEDCASDVRRFRAGLRGGGRGGSKENGRCFVVTGETGESSAESSKASDVELIVFWLASGPRARARLTTSRQALSKPRVVRSPGGRGRSGSSGNTCAHRVANIDQLAARPDLEGPA